MAEKKRKAAWLWLMGLSAFTLLASSIISFMVSSQLLRPAPTPPYLHVYNWYGLIPADVLRQFEDETGIRLKYDLYDNNEILEAKLLAGKSGYDVVIPSASPYIERQIRAGVFQKLDKTKLTHLHHLDPEIAEQLETVDPGLTYSIPFYWGTIGFAYVEEMILARMPDAPVASYRMLFDPEVVLRFKSCGVTLLEECIDIYPAVLAFLGRDSQSSDTGDLEAAQRQLLKIRPYIARFSGQRFVSEMLSGETCLAQAWSGDAQMAAQQARDSRKQATIRYVIPKEGGTMWIDAICIPRDAPHPDNAYKFINFLMRPEISAAIANYTMHPIANKSAKPLMVPEIRDNEIMYPAPEVMKRLRLDKVQNHAYEEKRTRNWLLVRQGAASP